MMADLLEVDPFGNGKWILAFDGRVFEVFGPLHPLWYVNNMVSFDSWRVRINHLNVEVVGPDKKGFHEVAFSTQATGASLGLKFTKLDDQQRSRFQPLLDALAEAAGSTPQGSASQALLDKKFREFQALLTQYGRLSSQPDDVRNAVVSELQTAGVPIDPSSLVTKLTDPAQFDTMLEVYKRHGVLPPEAALG